MKPPIHDEVSAPLEADDSLGDFLEQPVCELGFNGLSTDDLPPDSLIGTTVDGRYLIERALVPGGQSKVYFARALDLNGKPVCIKILLQDLVEDPYARRKFKHEVEALARIDHPGVVGVLGSGDLRDGRPYIAMQYVDGETLRSQIPDGGMDLERAASILKQIGAALEHVHQKGIFHRDLKPENIMVKRGTDSIVIVDFGIAKVKESVVAQTTVNDPTFGTLRYMSPERLRGEKITAASDIYSMGLIAYELVTGHRPFKATSAAQLIEMQKAGVRVKPTTLRETIPVKAEELLLRALSFNPQSREQNAKEFGDNLAQALLNSPAPQPRKRWVKAISGALIALFAVALLSFGIYMYVTNFFGSPIRSSPRSLRYWLTVQRMVDGKEYQPPFKSNGEGTFERGDKFQLSVFAPEPGFLYVLNEGPPEPNDDASFEMIHPRAGTNNGSASLGANQTIQSDWITFRGPAGTENFWLVWSPVPINELESAKTEAFKHPRGGINGEHLAAVKDFLILKKTELGAQVSHYENTQIAIVRSKKDKNDNNDKNEMLLTLVQFKHR